MKKFKYLLIPALLFIPLYLHGLTYQSGDFGLGSTSSISIATATINGLTVSSMTLTNVRVVTRIVIPSYATPRTNTTPAFVGEVILQTTSDPDQVCYSTGTTVTSWALMGAATTPCSN